VNARILFHCVVKRPARLRLQHLREPFSVRCVNSPQPDFRRSHSGQQDRTVQNGIPFVPGNLVRTLVARYAQYGR
jgi:hypothetical protein